MERKVCGEGVETVTVNSRDCEKSRENRGVTNVREKESQKKRVQEVVSKSYTYGHKKRVT